MNTERFLNEICCSDDVAHIIFNCDDHGNCRYASIVYTDKSVGDWHKHYGQWICRESTDMSINGGSVMTGREC